MFTPCQLNELKQIFNKNKNKVPNIHVRRELAKKMGVTETKIRYWLKYRVKMWKRNSGSDCKSESKSLLNQRKHRRFKFHELIELKWIFENNHYPDENIIIGIAQRMEVPKYKIETWFTDERRRIKNHVSSLTCAEGGYDNFTTSSTSDVNYPPTPFYSHAETMPSDYLYQHPQLQSQPDFSAAFSAEQYLSHHVPLTQWTDSDTQSFSTVGLPTYSFPATDSSPISVDSFMTHMSSDSY